MTSAPCYSAYGYRCASPTPPRRARSAQRCRSCSCGPPTLAPTTCSSTRFAGAGSLVLARLDHPARQIIYSDLALRRLRTEFPPGLARARGVTFLDEDARGLPSVDDASVDAVITDPPRGEHEEIGEPYPVFAAAVAHSMRWVLKPVAGWFVMLVARRLAEDLRTVLVDSNLVPRHEHEILVNGHPATALVGARRT